MKIALLVPEMPPDAVGGGGPVFHALATHLAARGHVVTVVTSATYRGPKDETAPVGFEIVRVPEFAHPSPAYRTSMPPIPSGAFWHAIARLRDADIINAHGYACPLVDVLGLFVDRRRVVYTLHGFLYTIPQRGGAIAAAYRVYDTLLGNRLLRRSPIVTAVSSAVQRQAADRGRRDCLVTTNGFTPIAPAALTPELARDADRAPFLLCIGRLQWLKGFDIAVTALQILRTRGHNLRLLIAGRNADYEEPLRKQIDELNLTGDVSLLGQVSGDRLAMLLRRCVAFLMPSRTEAFPATPLEAMSAGAPAILANVGGVPDIAKDRVNALLIESEDASGFADAVERVMNDGALRASLVELGRSRAKDFDWDEIAKRYEDAYTQMLRAGASE